MTATLPVSSDTYDLAASYAHEIEPEISELGTALRIALDGRYATDRARRRTQLEPGELIRPLGQTMEEARAWVTDKVADLTRRDIANGLQEESSVDGAHTVLAFELMAVGDGSLLIKCGVQFGLFAGAIANLGTDIHADYLREALAFKLPGSYAMTEYGHGSDVQNLETTITWTGTDFEVHSPTESAVKTYLGNAARDATMAVVFGQLIVGEDKHGIHAILVPIRSERGKPLPGVTIGDNGHKGGLQGVDNGTLAFDHVRVPRENLLNRYGGVTEDGRYHSDISSPGRRFFTMLSTLVRGRICVGVGGAIGARRALSIATRYGDQRRQFAQPGSSEGTLLLDYPSHQRKLLPGIATAYALGFAHNDIVALFDDVNTGKSDDVKRLELAAAALKVAQTSFANEITQVAREACGGAGYMAENGLTVLRQDLDVFATFEGDNTVLSLLVARGLLGDYTDQWKAMDKVAMVQASAAMFGKAVLESTPGRRLIEGLVAAAKRGAPAVKDTGWIAWMMEERAEHVLTTLAARLRPALKKKPAEAAKIVLRAQEHMLALSRAHTERLILDAFIVGIEECEDPAAKVTLTQLCVLYGLSRLEADKGWFLEHKLMSANRSKEVRSEIDRLCAALRPQAIALVEGLGIPQSWLGSQMLDD